MFDDFSEEVEETAPTEAVEEQPATEPSNRRFLMIAGGMAGVLVIMILCLVGYYFLNRGNGSAAKAQRETDIASTFIAQTQIAFANQATAAAANFTKTPTVAPSPTKTQAKSSTPVVAQATDILPAVTEEPRSLTMTALYAQLTEAAKSTQGPTTTAFATALPQTGLFDGPFGIPQLLALAAVAVLVIFLVRKLRTATE